LLIANINGTGYGIKLTATKEGAEEINNQIKYINSLFFIIMLHNLSVNLSEKFETARLSRKIYI
jgi:hypothetical protein